MLPKPPPRYEGRNRFGGWPWGSMRSRAPGVATTRPRGNLGIRDFWGLLGQPRSRQKLFAGIIVWQWEQRLVPVCLVMPKPGGRGPRGGAPAEHGVAAILAWRPSTPARHGAKDRLDFVGSASRKQCGGAIAPEAVLRRGLGCRGRSGSRSHSPDSGGVATRHPGGRRGGYARSLRPGIWNGPEQGRLIQSWPSCCG